jgi:hypothetical protein
MWIMGGHDSLVNRNDVWYSRNELWLKRSAGAEDPTVFAWSTSTITIKEGTSAAVSITPDSLLVDTLAFYKFDNPAPATSSVRIRVKSGYNQGGQIVSGSEYELQTTASPLQ